jgi:hypothetical protein
MFKTYTEGGVFLMLKSWFGRFLKRITNQSDQLIKDKPLWTEGDRAPVNIEYKMQLNASELTSNQELIDSIVKKLIQQDTSKRQYAGRSDKEFFKHKQRVYQYESYRTQNVKLVPNANRFDIYVEGVYIGKLPKEYTKETKHFLQSTVVMAFAYVTGGPYKFYDKKAYRVKQGKEPFDINIYIQFS